MTDPPAAPCDGFLDALGLSGGTIEQCTALLPDLYWVKATGPAGGFVGAVVTDGGKPVAERGCRVGAAWLARIGVYDLVVDKPFALVEGLAAVGALPEGFTPAHLTDKTDPDGTSRLTTRPFRLELIATEPERPRFGGSGTGPGRTPPPQRRAVLTGDADYRFTWTIERRTGGGTWTTESSTPCE